MSKKDQNSSVHIAGAVLASLQFDMLNEEREIEGFLIGQVVKRTIDEISDHARDASSRIETRIIVTGHIPSTRKCYDMLGQVDYTLLNSLMADKKDSVLGYFKFRRNTRMDVSLREAAVYDSLLKRPVTNVDLSLLECQLLCIVTAHPPETSTLTLDFSFYNKTATSTTFQRLPLVIGNLVESTQAQYHAFASTMPAQSPLDAAMASFSLNYVQDYINIYKQSIGMLTTAADELLESEAELARLRELVANQMQQN
ncbi:hypothetical protein SmJEL517_g00235 [Synchytrium microbalum]|uniref:JAB1/MPN/MOV34 metalloenzyme domain-containing protein n=1 Tax=Synchytrium microbalum TaxID=1806994 RepID=A0A507CES9_9FUNG|nr:uncharacterized protein SmJEL517_g00235 [Synchytrium microbalum]TPX37991.1 hypothetical protein SmJEL517_g00235 [Synchytrium microbalum]